MAKTKANNGKAVVSLTITESRALTLRTSEGRGKRIDQTLTRIAGLHGLTDIFRASLCIDMAADSTGKDTMSIAEVGEAYGYSKSQAGKYVYAGRIALTHDSLRDACLALSEGSDQRDAYESLTDDQRTALDEVRSLVAVCLAQTSPLSAEVDAIATSPSDESPAARLAALVAARVAAKDEDESGEDESGEDESGEDESGEATAEDLADRDARMIAEALVRINARDGGPAAISADLWQEISNGYNTAKTARAAAARKAKAVAA